MYLLILRQRNDVVVYLLFTSQHVSINSLCSSRMTLTLSKFTSQHVSINSVKLTDKDIDFIHLHSNMYLLILMRFVTCNEVGKFTFQHVSINSDEVKNLNGFGGVYLHSNMYLLIQCVYYLYTI